MIPFLGSENQTIRKRRKRRQLSRAFICPYLKFDKQQECFRERANVKWNALKKSHFNKEQAS